MKVRLILFVFLLTALAAAQSADFSRLFDPNSDYRYRGQFRPTFYRTVDETQFTGGKTVAVRDAEGNEIAAVSENFKKHLDIEGSGRLADGRVINFHSRATDGIRYRVVDVRFGLGVRNYQLLPYRSIAVDPTKILIGSVVFIPQAVGIPLPDGTFHDGYFFAHDIGGAIKNDRIDLYVGFESDVDNAFTRSGKLANLQPLDLYVVKGVMARSMNTRFRMQYEHRYIKQTWEMVAADFDSLMQYTNTRFKKLNERIQYISQRGLGTPYLIFNLGEGPQAAYDPDPTMDFGRTDCMTFCEHTLALSLSGNYRDMYKTLQKIRYKNGKIGMKTRNHYTIADWLPNNDWLLYNACEEIGKEYCSQMTKTIDRKKDFLGMGMPEADLQDVPPPQTLTVSYIPTENLLKIKDRLQGGEVVSIVSSKPGIISAHMGIIVIDEWGNVIFRHASSPRKTHEVIDERLEDVVNYLSKSSSRVGMLFMRTKEDTRIGDVTR